MQHGPSPAAAIAAAAEEVCRRYLPNGRRLGRYWICGDLDGARGRSLFVRLSGSGKPGGWTDAATGRQPRPGGRTHDRHRAAARRRAPQVRQRAQQQPLQAAPVRRQHGVQDAVAVGKPVAPAQDVEGRPVRGQHAPVPVQLHDPDALAVQQPRHARTQRIGRRQRLADHDRPVDMRQQMLVQTQPGGLPAVAADGVAGTQDDAQAVRPVEARGQTVPAAEKRQALVEGRRRLPLVFGIELGAVGQPAAGKPPDALYPLVQRVVDIEILAHRLRVALATVQIPGEVEARVVAGPLADSQDAPAGSDRLLDHGRGGGPERVVEGGLVQQTHDTLEGVVRVHASPSRGASRPVPTASGNSDERLIPRHRSSGRTWSGLLSGSLPDATILHKQGTPPSFKITGQGETTD